MGNLRLVDAFAAFGGKPTSRLHGASAIAADGAMILTCSGGRYQHPEPGVLRYEDRVHRETRSPVESRMLGQHLALALDGQLPVRMIIVSRRPTVAGKATQTIHVRSDLVGTVSEFDGDRFCVDFVRIPGTPHE